MLHILINIIYFISLAKLHLLYSVMFEIKETIKYKIYYIKSNHRMAEINKMKHGNSLLNPNIPFGQEEHVNLFIPFNMVQ